MEGLLPMVYKAIKRTRTRTNYECLSSGAAQTFNVADFYVNGGATTTQSDNGRARDTRKAQYRRHSSVGELSFQLEEKKVDGDEFKGGRGELGRFRSHRRMFSCLSADA